MIALPCQRGIWELLYWTYLDRNQVQDWGANLCVFWRHHWLGGQIKHGWYLEHRSTDHYELRKRGRYSSPPFPKIRLHAWGIFDKWLTKVYNQCRKCKNGTDTSRKLLKSKDSSSATNSRTGSSPVTRQHAIHPTPAENFVNALRIFSCSKWVPIHFSSGNSIFRKSNKIVRSMFREGWLLFPYCIVPYELESRVYATVESV